MIKRRNVVVIAGGAAVAGVFGAHLSGFTAWLVCVFIHLIYLVTFQSRVLVFMQWVIQDLTFGVEPDESAVLLPPT